MSFNKRGRMRLAILPTLLVALVAGCGGSGSTGPTSSDQVIIQGFVFNPSPRTISAGTTVTWVNRDASAHTTTGGSGTETWNSGSLSQNASFSHQFTVPGTYQYVCTIHPGMHGTIIVN